MEGFRPSKEQLKHIKRCKQLKKENEGKPVQMPWILVTVCQGCGDCVVACVGKGIKMVNLDKKVPNAWLVHGLKDVLDAASVPRTVKRAPSR